MHCCCCFRRSARDLAFGMSLVGLLLVAVKSACQKSRSNPYSYPRVEVRCGPVPWRAEACKKLIQLLMVDRSARGSMKTAAKCVLACESQDYQMHRPVERTLRRRHYPVSLPLPDECPLPIIHPSQVWRGFALRQSRCWRLRRWYQRSLGEFCRCHSRYRRGRRCRPGVAIRERVIAGLWCIGELGVPCGAVPLSRVSLVETYNPARLSVCLPCGKFFY